MKNLSLKIVELIFLLLIAVSCNRSEVVTNRTVTVSIQPFKYFVEYISGDEVSVNVIVPPGASPATFEPPPSVIRSLKTSDAVFFNRYLGFEKAWMDKLLQVNPGISVCYLADNQDLIATESHRHGDHFHHQGVDPHFWMSVSGAGMIANDVLNYLTELYPSDSALFAIRHTELLNEIDNVRAYTDSLFSILPNTTFLIFHPSLTYYARDFGLEQLPIEFEGKEPTASWVKDLIGRAESENISAILVQKEFNRKSAEVIAAEIDAEVIQINPLSGDWPEAMREIAHALAGVIIKN